MTKVGLVWLGLLAYCVAVWAIVLHLVGVIR